MHSKYKYYYVRAITKDEYILLDCMKPYTHTIKYIGAE